MLKEVVSKFDEIKLAYLFGSYAESKAMPVSDLDIAVLTEESKVIPYLTAELSRVLGIAYRLRIKRWYQANLNNEKPEYKPIIKMVAAKGAW
ncbi:MAG: nucleotidyltransferase domain-containing protein [Candidatus Bathyarchaeia archaeon]|nr:nucleotidyltransferase domain-containing protein [Candidatus Bathyarchaeota archaeon]